MPLDPMLVVALASVLTAFAGWIRGRIVGREQGREQGIREGISLRPPPRVVRVRREDGTFDYCAECGHVMQDHAHAHPHPTPVHREKP